ncbi:acetyltransferase [Lacipirellula limnantheis]|uniref:UDP-N-acetylbacillosamine N-acetyltransferase n=1 Tax=Lacipirellula limnantheis TaxID=2528024 RepID=A0A517U1C1_9BACT|nr:acetyltransferase [Lacipirellula limnantheis]QDT74411.1 UDP-N-acetylbacillosamine N-acetyltransferase [Lacipirellula limnantheis]
MADVVIFGVKDFASLAHFYLRHDSEHRVVAFTVHREFLPAEGEFEGLPVVALEDLADGYPPDKVRAFAPMSHRKMNRLREGIYNDLKGRGYELISYVSSRATTFPERQIGDNCFILEDNTIQPFATIGDNVVIWSGNHIGHHSVVESHAFITSHVVISGHCRIGAYSFLGVNATLKDQITLAEGTLIGMGANITKDTEPWSLYKADATRASKISSADIDF